MTVEEKNKKKLELIELVSKFDGFPKEELLELIPDGLTNEEAIKWFDSARNFWNFRNTKYDMFFHVFEKALEITKNKVA